MKAHLTPTVTQQPLQYMNLADSSDFLGTEKSQISTQVMLCKMQHENKKEQSVLSTYLVGKRHGILKIQHECNGLRRFLLTVEAWYSQDTA